MDKDWKVWKCRGRTGRFRKFSAEIHLKRVVMDGVKAEEMVKSPNYERLGNPSMQCFPGCNQEEHANFGARKSRCCAR